MIFEDLLIYEVEKVREEVIRIRRDLHMYPELGMEEKRTSSIVKSFLGSMDIDNKTIAGTGVIGTIYGANTQGRTVALRADMDALPIQDKKDVSYSSKVPSKMHACGHDAHTAILLGTAIVLSRLKHMMPGNIRLIFQPAEETIGGAKNMIEEGALIYPSVSGVIGLHMEETLETGHIGVRRGMMNASSNQFELAVTGKSCHGAYPHKGIDAILISAHVITALQSIISRELNPLESAVITLGVINGGSGPNIICDRVTIKGIVRAFDEDLRYKILKRIEDIAHHIIAGMQGSYELNILDGYPSLMNDDTMIKILMRAAEKHINHNKIITLENPSLGVEDFAYYGKHVPSVFYKLGCKNIDKGIIHPAHGPLFDIDEDALPLGVILQCQAAYEFLSCAEPDV